MTNPTISFTYGDSTEGTVTFGAGSSDVRPIIAWDVNVNYSTFVFSATVRIIANSMSEMDSQLELLDKLKHNSGDFTLVSGSTTLYEINEANKGFAYRARTDLSTADDPNDHKLRRTFTFQMVAERPADSTADDGGRRYANITCTVDTTSRHRVVVSGLYTAIATTDAVVQFKAKAETFAVAILATFEVSAGVAMDFEQLTQNYAYDDEKALLNFDFIYQQRRLPESTSTPDLAPIKDQRIVMSRQAVYQLGLDDIVPVIAVDINYQAAIDSTETTYDEILDLYKSTLKQYLLDVAKDRFATGGAQVIVNDESVRIGFDSSSIMVMMSVLLKNDGEFSDLIVWDKTVAYSLNMQKDVRQRWTGAPHEYTTFSPGPMIESSVVVREVILGPPSYRGQDTVFANQSTPSTMDPDTASDLSCLQVPGFPPFTGLTGRGVALSGEGKSLGWILMGSEISHTPKFIGTDPDGISSGSTQLTETNYVTRWLWGSEVRDSVVGDAPANENAESEITVDESLLGGGHGSQPYQTLNGPSAGTGFTGVQGLDYPVSSEAYYTGPGK